MGQAVGYIRRSSKDSGGHVSREEQQQAIAQLATQHGASIGQTFIDWGRSGGDYKPRAGEDVDSDALTHRPGFRALLRAVEEGSASHVFAVRIDRLGRSQNALGRLWAACQRTGTRVVTTEGDMHDPDNPATVLLRGMLGVFAEYYLAEQVRKNARAMEYCRARGDTFGQPAYGYAKRTPKHHGTARVEMVEVDPEGIATVLDAYREAGHNYRQAARLLNEAGVPPARTDKWYATSVAAIVRRHAPDLAVQAAERRARTTIPRLFRGLLRCPHHDADHPVLMTPSGSEASRSFGYLCPQGHHDARHPRPYVVSERRLLPWIMEEAARLRAPEAVIVEGDAYDDSADRRALEAMRAAIGEDAYTLAVANLDAKRAEHGGRLEELLDVPQAIDWEHDDVTAINGALRALWRHVQLGPDLMPVDADWKVPQWRA